MAIPVPAPTLKRKEQVKIRKAFKEKFAGLDATVLSDIVVDNCGKLRDAPANAAIVIDDLPIHVQYLLLGYIRGAKGETEDEAEPETETQPDPESEAPQKILPLRKRKNRITTQNS
jgi:hypothetical protein